MRFFYFNIMLIEDLFKLFKKNPIICTDSRNVSIGSLFFALKGDKFDGNNYAAEAIQKGASYAIIDNQKFNLNNSYILVNDVLSTLQTLANYHRRQLGIPIIAITGTNGKTTTKELFTAVFSKKFKVTATTGNLNNHVGVPVTLLSMKDDTKIGIVEMGANHLNEISTLCNIAEPNYGLITNIGKAHLEGFGSFKGIIKAKTELYKYVEKSNGTIFYNSDNSILLNNIKNLNCSKVSYGSSEGSFIQAKLISSDPYLNFSIHLADQTNKNKDLIINTHLVGGYNLENALAAMCAGLYFNIPMDDIQKAIETYEPTNFQSQFKKLGNNELLLDFYNANPSSMEVALRNFSESSERGLKKVIILGEMLELGKESELEHIKILKLIESLRLKDVFLVGKGFKLSQSKTYKYFDNSELLKEYLREHKLEKSFILIKGSRGVKLEKILDCFQIQI